MTAWEKETAVDIALECLLTCSKKRENSLQSNSENDNLPTQSSQNTVYSIQQQPNFFIYIMLRYDL